MDVPSPLPPAAGKRCVVSASAASSLARLIIASCSLLLAGCYTGVPDPDGAPWEGADDGPTSSAGTDGGGDGESGGDGMTGPASGGSTTGAGDSGSGPSGGDTGGGDGLDDGAADTGGGSASDTGAVDTGPSDDGGSQDDVPDNAYCDPVSNWQPEWIQLEEEILQLVNQYRAQGANCGSEGSFGPAGPLTMHPALRCAARKHSLDMHERNFFDHVNPSGESPWDRMEQAGYSYSYAGENIAGGNATASATMQQWMDSDGHCANIMNPDFEEIGVGYYPGGQWGHLWTQAFGTP